MDEVGAHPPAEQPEAGHGDGPASGVADPPAQPARGGEAAHGHHVHRGTGLFELPTERRVGGHGDVGRHLGSQGPHQPKERLIGAAALGHRLDVQDGGGAGGHEPRAAPPAVAGGIGRYTARLAAHLPAWGWEVDGFCALHRRRDVTAALAAEGVAGQAATIVPLPRPALYDAWARLGQPDVAALAGLRGPTWSSPRRWPFRPGAAARWW